jgi:hypothetical protein
MIEAMQVYRNRDRQALLYGLFAVLLQQRRNPVPAV